MTNTNNKSVSILELKKFFNLSQATGDENSLKRRVVTPEINRPGFELTGFYKRSSLKRLMILGDKEIAYIKTLSEEVQIERFSRLINDLTPAIIISKNHRTPRQLRKIATERNFPIFRSELPTYRLMVDMIGYLDEKLAPTDNYHAVLINVFGKGVLIIGESGIGKSELALELIRKGHVLIADDRVVVSRVHRIIVGRPPELLKGFLEIRGLGIIDIVQMFGASAILKESNVDFVIELEKWNPKRDYARLGVEDPEFQDILGVAIPKIVFPVKEGRNMSVLVEAAVTDFTLKQMGIDSSKTFGDKVFNHIKGKNKSKKR